MGEAALDKNAKHYRSRVPQNSQYYQCVQDHFEAFEQVYEERFSRQYGFFRSYVKEVKCVCWQKNVGRKQCGHYP